MKAISLWQPWATAVAIGAKQIETRSWWTSHRGELAIHAARKNTPELRNFFGGQACNPLREAGFDKFDQLPFGAIVATARLTECRRTTDIDYLTETEKSLGDFRPGRYAWILADIKALPEPVPFCGARSLFDWPKLELTPQLLL